MAAISLSLRGIALAVGVSIACFATAAPPSDLDARVEAVIREQGVPGMAVAIVENGQVVHAKGYGVRKLGATERVVHFLLEVVSRLRVTRRDMKTQFDLTLSQSMIGDAVGLTNVYVSRALKQMQAEGFIRRDGHGIDLLDETRMKQSVDFEDRHFRIDTTWFPKS